MDVISAISIGTYENLRWANISCETITDFKCKLKIKIKNEMAPIRAILSMYQFSQERGNGVFVPQLLNQRD